MLNALPRSFVVRQDVPPDGFYLAYCAYGVDLDNFLLELPRDFRAELKKAGYWERSIGKGNVEWNRSYSRPKTNRQKYELKLAETFANAEAVPLF